MSVPVLVLLLGLEVVLRQIPNDYKYKASYFDSYASELQSLILGSSHSFFGVDPIYFRDKAFNASHVSQGLEYDYEILNKYKSELVNLRTIYIPISYFTFWKKLKNGNNSWRRRRYFSAYGFENDMTLKDFIEITGNFKKNFFMAKDYIFRKKNNITCSSSGWCTLYNSENAKNLEETGIEAAQRHSRAIHTEELNAIYYSNVGLLKSMIEWCRSNNVRVVLFTPPAAKSYRDNLDVEQIQQSVNTAIQLAGSYENCLYENMLADGDFIAEDFYDADHLSEIGAKKLSIKLDYLGNTFQFFKTN